MGYTERIVLSNRSNYGVQRNVSSIIFFAVHYTANDGDSDEANANYFKNNVVKASAHYFIDDNSITQSVPDNFVAWAVGGAKYSDCAQTGGGKYYGVACNSNSLSFELCDTVRDGKYNLSAKTRENAINFIARKMIQYNVNIDHVIRHFDVNGKMCPRYFAGKENESAWKEFKNELDTEYKKLKGEKEEKSKQTVTESTSTKKKTTIAKPTLKLGSNGAEVKKLQKHLNSLKFYDPNKKKLIADGDFGTKTEYALKAFQKAKKLTVDGIYGNNSYKAMDKAINK